jgi:hypothetical protein
MPGRDNGFVARHYVPLADLDPRLADAMLEALRAESIAAYIVPSAGSLGGYLEVHMPERPRDRLWVDRQYHDRATTLLSVHSDRHAEPTDIAAVSGIAAESETAPAIDIASDNDSADDAWARIVAGFDLPAYDRDPDGASPVPRRIVRPVERASDPGTPSTAAPRDEYDPLSILDEHFVPAPPPPLPRLRKGTRWALLTILLGVALIVGRSFSDSIPDAVALGVLAIVGGFIGLVAMMREDRPSDSDPDDGAVV